MDADKILNDLLTAYADDTVDEQRPLLLELSQWHANGGFLPRFKIWSLDDIPARIAFQLGRISMAIDACDRDRYADALVTLMQETVREE